MSEMPSKLVSASVDMPEVERYAALGARVHGIDVVEGNGPRPSGELHDASAIHGSIRLGAYSGAIVVIHLPVSHVS